MRRLFFRKRLNFSKNKTAFSWQISFLLKNKDYPQATSRIDDFCRQLTMKCSTWCHSGWLPWCTVYYKAVFKVAGNTLYLFGVCQLVCQVKTSKLNFLTKLSALRVYTRQFILIFNKNSARR